MTSIDDLARRAAAAAHAQAAADTDIERGLARILEADDLQTLPSARSVRGGTETGGRRTWALASAAAIITVAVSATVWWSHRDAEPAIVQTPTLPSSVSAPTASTQPEPTPSMVPAPTPSRPPTSAPTTTTSPPPASATGLAVSYLDPPPVAELDVLGTLDLDDSSRSSWSLAVADTGVAVLSDGTLHTLTWSHERRDIPLATRLDSLLAIGPDLVAYGTVSGPNPTDTAVHAVALQGDRIGQTIAATPIDVNRVVELPAAAIGHGPDGLVIRTRPTEAPLAGYVDITGAPIAWPDAPPQATVDAAGTVRVDGRQEWALSIERHPDAPDPYAGPSAPAPGADSTYVYWTGIGPPEQSGTDFPDSTINVIASLHPDGSATWRTIPLGWSVAATDTAGTILTHTDDSSGTLTIARLRTSRTPAPPPTATTPTDAGCDLEQPGSGVEFPIRRCDRGWGVVWVRKALAADGDPAADGDASADFTDAVEAAVRRYQARHGLEADGLVGPLTWFTMHPDFATPSSELLVFDADGSGQIEPAEVWAIDDANAPCEARPDDSCTTSTP